MNNVELIPLSDIAEINPPRKTLQFADTDEVSFLPMSDVTDSAHWIGNQTRQLREVKSGYTYFEEGDILFAKITPCTENGKGCLAVGLKNGIGFGSTEFHVLRAKPNGDPRFIFQWTIAVSLRSQAAAQMIGSAGQQRVPEDFLSRFQIPALSRSEQTAIADILATVDRAIAQSEALIAKQRRIKAGLLHDLLTRGIDAQGNLRHPSTHRFKPSPVGPVPEEWEVGMLGELSSRITSGSRGWAKYYSDEGALFIRIGNLTREHINLSLDGVQRVTPPIGSEGKRTSLEVGDLLISVTADLGIIGVVPDGFGEAYINQHIALVRLDQSTTNPWWVGNYLSGTTGQLHFASLNESGAKAGLNLPTVASIPVPIPKMQEQNVIVQTLQQADIVVKQEDAYLSKLQRLKTGLMQDLLSGRVSVTGLVETISARE